jgi:hypothetical protein
MKEGIYGKLDNKNDSSVLLKHLNIAAERAKFSANCIMFTPHLAQINRKGFPLCRYDTKNKACLSLSLISSGERQPSRRKGVRRQSLVSGYIKG